MFVKKNVVPALVILWLIVVSILYYVQFRDPLFSLWQNLAVKLR